VVAGCLALPLIAAVSMMFGMRVYSQWQHSQPELAGLGHLLNLRAAMNLPWFKYQPHPDDRTLGIYIASHYRPVITNASQWNTLYALTMVSGEKRRFAEQCIALYPNPTEEEIRAATAAIRPLLPNNQAALDFSFKPWFTLVVFGVSLLMYVCLPALLAAVIFRSGLVLLACGLAVARRDGRRASRRRALWRAAVAWSPVLLAPVLLAVLTPLTGAAIAATILAVLWCGLTAWSLALPSRSLPDRIAGTWLVPR
jgi:hypothetical protein